MKFKKKIKKATLSLFTQAMKKLGYSSSYSKDIKKYQKKLRSKSVRSIYKARPKSPRPGCNAWPKNNIYNINYNTNSSIYYTNNNIFNINNNIKLV